MATKKKAAAKKKVASKTATKKTAAKKPATTRKKVAGKKTAVKKTAAKKVAAKKAPAKKAVAKKKAASKKTAARKTPARKAAAKKTAEPGVHHTVIEGIAPYQETAGEEYMNEAQRKHFREILLAWKRELMEEVDRTVHHMQDEAANFPDPNDRATQESEFSMELRTRDRERKLIKKIDEALEALEQEEYGYCEACGVEIGIRRLEARPTANLCIDCKTLDEIREKQLGK
ncbi:RNA polymerase-binding protein DksA [Thiohalobacter sp. IOR34]|uniref:RNA polymerase-binding protein DksA n=1 Tax=Thiohalobacter sp. IOR34 TaxID=3057176 RepID=UPI0025B21569|nr:RNA polymerase-binding protein DksA [Thiohalobacter sp. IOR34]WJW76523.1 RNA polymerase-binding protein DksA [Thiohalobacter sp. IOR34]